MNSSKLSTVSLVIAVFVGGVLVTDHAAAARGGGHSGGGRSGHGHGHGHGHHHHRVFLGASSGLFLGSWYYPGDYWPGYYPGYASMQPPPVTYYIERGDQDAPGDAWFFCPSANAYFPMVVECPTEWQRVPARP